MPLGVPAPHLKKYQFKKGHHLNLGVKRDEKTRKKISMTNLLRYSRGERFGFQKGKLNPSVIYGSWNKGKKHIAITGSRHYRWVRDRTKLKKQNRRNDSLYKEWRRNVYLKFDFRCFFDNEKCDNSLVAHHIKSWFEHPKLRYVVANGILLCHYHHPKTRKEEKLFEEFYLTQGSIR